MVINRKPTRTISGVAPVAVMLPPRKCDHGVCSYCPSLNVPQSYTPESPVVLRAREVEYSGRKQVENRLKAYEAMGHPKDKVELIIMGGTFLQYDRDFQFNFVKELYDALNGKKSKTLEEAKKLNEHAKHRCVALCIETRPDWCSEKHIKDMLTWGTTRVEIGVQALDNKSYNITNRGHKVEDVVQATRRLKEAGFKIGYHLMPGVPGSNLKKDIRLFKKVFKDSRFKPDQIKIYPCQVLKGSALEQQYYDGKYVPYTKDETAEILTKMLSLTPRYCRAMRIMREIPPAFLVAGIVNIDLRKVVEEEIRKKKIKIKEIRFREVGFALRDKREVDEEIKFKKTKYLASQGKEIFLEAVNKDDILFGLLRLRLNKTKTATVREIHVYGPALDLGEEGNISQHKGLGKELMKMAEEISKRKRKKFIRVISGVGVREYYENLGYSLDKEKIYMERKLD
jgi:elongator complex protein 3